MEFRVEIEIKLIPKELKHVFGPCLLCGSETEYGDQIPRLGMDWLRKQFEPDARLRNERAVRIGVAPKTRSLAVLEALVCADCQAKLVKERWAAAAERDSALQRRAQRSSRYYARAEAQWKSEGRGPSEKR